MSKKRSNDVIKTISKTYLNVLYVQTKYYLYTIKSLYTGGLETLPDLVVVSDFTGVKL